MILSCGIIDKDGEVYVARQYEEMSKSQVEALYSAFPRLITKGKQHTFIETKDVRYVYQSINNFYCVLITDKQSNILEDIKTLRLIVQAINEHACINKGLVTEDGIYENRFDLVFVLDEIVAMGVRQIDNLTQLNTVLEMKSEEEKAMMKALTKKEKEAKAIASEKSKQLDKQRRNELLNAAESMKSMKISKNIETTINEPVAEIETKPIKPSKVISRGRALKLRAKK